jgi:transposase
VDLTGKRGRCLATLTWRRGLGEDHLLRLIRMLVNEALAAMASDFEALYSGLGQPSIAPEKLLRAMLLQAFYSIRSERQLMERLGSTSAIDPPKKRKLLAIPPK